MNFSNTKFKTLMVYLLIIGIVLYLPNCTSDNQIIEPVGTQVNGRDLIAIKTTTAPTLDGTIEAAWATAPLLEFDATVPDATGDLFRSYVGRVMPKGTLRAMYDNENIYFLAEWADPTKNEARQPWYFDPATKKWAQDSGSPTFSATGAITRQPSGEDKFAMLWNVNNSVVGWNSATCFKSCHTGLGATDGHGRHYTNQFNERVDMWHWKANRSNPAGQVDDQYQDNTYPNGRKSDARTAGGEAANSQSLKITGTETSVTVPKYFIPAKTGYYWVFQSEIDSKAAKLITAVDENGVLSYDGGTIDPVADVEYQRKGAGLGSKVIPAITLSPMTGSRGDISCVGIHTGTGWIVEFKRKLNTGDNVNDVDFSSLEDQYFGFATFDNIGPAHAIKANLKLIFKK